MAFQQWLIDFGPVLFNRIIILVLPALLHPKNKTSALRSGVIKLGSDSKNDF